jgi:N-dimethylarginine dimethylaminohydrolase
MVGALRRVVVRRPSDALRTADPVLWHYQHLPDLAVARHEHDEFVARLRAAGAEVVYHDVPLPADPDAMYVHDPVLISDRGAILLRMGKSLRRGEEEAIGLTLEAAGVPIAGRLTEPALAEGGDLLWLDPETLVAGIGFRTNVEAVEQLREILGAGVTVLHYDLPYHTGPDACLHLMSTISVIDARLAVVYPKLMPVAFYQELLRRQFTLVEIPDAEYETMACNVLALAPRRCLMVAGNPLTERRLRDQGCEVQTYSGVEISLNCEGGPTCLTRPILRDPLPPLTLPRFAAHR